MSHDFKPSNSLPRALFAVAALVTVSACSSTINPSPSSSGSGSPGTTGGAGSGKTDVAKPGESGGAAGEKRVFITSVAYEGNLAVVGRGDTGVEGADALCQLAADAAELGGTFKAFLGDSTRQAGDNLADVGPWYTVPDGAGFNAKVFNNKANLATSPLVAMLNDERGAPADEIFWVGDSTSHCDDWLTSSADYLGELAYAAAGTEWRGSLKRTCDSAHRLLCFEQ